ncbi:MAG: DUF2330 domain-containing protein [Alphaproteobacteria bacterium]|nr:DUF2330 domain-containing protein [Alphaproteobacteria bacterium]
MIRILSLLALMAGLTLAPGSAQAFCGFFVSKAGADLFNQASKVVMARADDRTVITMANDFQGDVEEFAIVFPVPEVLKESQINVGENRILEHLDAYTAPRLVEYYDANPCAPVYKMEMMRSAMPMAAMMDSADQRLDAAALGVKIEAEYTVGEYDIVILSAKQSDGLQTYLNQEGYKIPKGADKVLNSYIKQDMKFFLAKVNLEEQAKSGYTYLRPIQVAFESEKFMLPIRLGTLNAKGPQDLILYTLSREGRVETANYRTVKIPSDTNIPLFVKDTFGDFYQAMFSESVKKESMKAVFLEYAWDMGWCDPCAADPVPNEDLISLGAWWLAEAGPEPIPGRGPVRMIVPPQPDPANVYVTRLHLRYDAQTFPEDLLLQQTKDRDNFQGRYILNHPWSGEMNCEAGKQYLQSLPERFEKEAQNLSQLTGWEIAGIREKMDNAGQPFEVQPMPEPRPWWEKIWGGQEK